MGRKNKHGAQMPLDPQLPTGATSGAPTSVQMHRDTEEEMFVSLDDPRGYGRVLNSSLGARKQPICFGQE